MRDVWLVCAAVAWLRAPGTDVWVCWCRLKIHYTVDRPTPGWRYSIGFIDLDMVEKSLFKYEPGTISVLCGPPPMLKFACHPNLEKMGFEKGVTSIEF